MEILYVCIYVYEEEERKVAGEGNEVYHCVMRNWVDVDWQGDGEPAHQT